jgi:DHA1 family tetracycline resistance protein-like MFS transporter
MTKKLYFLFFTIFLDMLGLGILIPVIPQLLGEPSSPHYLLSASQADLGLILLGFLTAIYPIAMFFASPILGALSDKYGRKPVLVVSILGTAISYFVFAYAIMTKNIPLLFASRIIDGATGGNISVAQAAVADLSAPEDRTKNYGMMGAAFGLGFIFGPFIGGILSSPSVLPFFNAYTPFIFSGVLSLLNVFLIISYFKESIKEKHPDRKIHLLASIHNIVKAKKYHDIRYLFLVSFLFNFGIAFFFSFFNVYLTNKFLFSTFQIGNFFAYVGVWIIITQLVVVRYASKRFSEINILGPAYILAGLTSLLYLVPKNPWFLLLVVPLAAIPNGIQQANFTSFLTKKTDESVRGEVLGISTSMSSLGQTIPPILGGFIAAMTASYVPIVLSSTIIFITGLVFIYKVKKPHDNARDKIKI